MKKTSASKTISVVAPLYKGAIQEAKHPDAKHIRAVEDMDASEAKLRYMSRVFCLPLGHADALKAYNDFLSELINRPFIKLIQDPNDSGWGPDGTRYHHVRWIEPELPGDLLDQVPAAPEEFAGAESRRVKDDKKQGAVAVPGGKDARSGSGEPKLRGGAPKGQNPAQPAVPSDAPPQGVHPDVAGDS